MVRTKGQRDARKAQRLSITKRPRSAVKSQRKARRRARTTGGLVLPRRWYLSRLLQTRRRITRCVLHPGAESQRATRFVLLSILCNAKTVCSFFYLTPAL